VRKILEGFAIASEAIMRIVEGIIMLALKSVNA
jgi:hypothetical protein